MDPEMRAKLGIGLLGLGVLLGGMFAPDGPGSCMSRPREPEVKYAATPTLWEIPETLRYPGWIQMFPENSSAYFSTDDIETIRAWYRAQMPEAEEFSQAFAPWVGFHNDAYAVVLTPGSGRTKIEVRPLRD